MSFNWADEVEETLAEAAGQEQPIRQFAHPVTQHEEEEETTQRAQTTGISIPTPKVVDSKEAVAITEAAPSPSGSPAQLQPTPSSSTEGGRQPGTRNGGGSTGTGTGTGIMQSRWATAPDEPAVEPSSPATKKRGPTEQRGKTNVSPGKDNRRRRGTGNSGTRKESTTPSGRPGGSREVAGSSPTRVSKKNEGANEQAKAKAAKAAKAQVPNARNGKAGQPVPAGAVVYTATTTTTTATTLPKLSGARCLPSDSDKAATVPSKTAHIGQSAATAMTTSLGIGNSPDDDPGRASGSGSGSGSSVRKSEISLSRWA